MLWMLRVMKPWLAQLLRQWADRIDSHTDRLVITDEYGITRCQVNGEFSESDDLPPGWEAHLWHDEEQCK